MGRRGSRVRVQAVVVCAMAAGVQLAGLAPARGQLEAKRAQAAELQARIQRQGEALSIADERFNQAQIQRKQIDEQAASARRLEAASEARWLRLKEQLARRVRLLYMHPGAAIDAWFGERSLSELARAQKFGSAVLIADNELVMKTEKARRELLARAKRMEELKGRAQAKEEELAGRRTAVSHALGEQRALLSSVNGDIARLMEQERQRELARARAQASRSQRTIPVIGGTSGSSGGSAPPDEENLGPPPPVNGGAGKAVSTAAAQIGKPYEWAASGPDSFDCSGLTMYAWSSAGVSLPHSSGAQYSSLPHVSRSDLQPGDLVFYGSPIHHVGIYEGGGVMINAPETGENVRRDPIARPDYAGAARP